MLCASCIGKCQEIVNEKSPADIQCPACEGDGCSECDGGWFTLTQCPSKYIGRELIGDIQVITSSEHHLPVAGGVLDQSAWWFELSETLRREEARIEQERSKR